MLEREELMITNGDRKQNNICICRVPEVDPYQSTIGTAMLYQKSIDFWYSYYLYQKSIDFWYSTNCTRSRSTFGTALIVPKLDRLLG